jgi:hypothetical protein
VLNLKKWETQSFIKGLTGYEIGQKVFWRKEQVVKETCTTCGGEHKLKTKLGENYIWVDCPFCNADGEMETARYYTAEPDHIRSIYITATNVHPERIYGKVDIKIEPIFYLMEKRLEQQASDIYKTEEEAISGCQNGI